VKRGEIVKGNYNIKQYNNRRKCTEVYLGGFSMGRSEVE
jgi:hypothetical protein